jgi:hypothetical protein
MKQIGDIYDEYIVYGWNDGDLKTVFRSVFSDDAFEVYRKYKIEFRHAEVCGIHWVEELIGKNTNNIKL